MTVDIPLLRKGVEWVEEQEALPILRRRWNQGAYIVAWRAWLMCEVPPTEYREIRALREPATRQLFDCGTACCFAGYIAQECEPGFTEYSIEQQNGLARGVAIQHLGISEGQAEVLFDGNNTARGIRAICERIAGEPL